jgi:hypothetical protein
MTIRLSNIRPRYEDDIVTIFFHPKNFVPNGNPSHFSRERYTSKEASLHDQGEPTFHCGGGIKSTSP